MFRKYSLNIPGNELLVQSIQANEVTARVHPVAAESKYGIPSAPSFKTIEIVQRHIEYVQEDYSNQESLDRSSKDNVFVYQERLRQTNQKVGHEE